MVKICPECHKINNGGYLIISTNLLLGILFTVLGIIRISFGILESSLYSLTLTIILLIAGYINLKSYFFGGNQCPHCSNEKMIPVDSPEAEELIQKPKYDYRYKICSFCYAVSKFANIKKYNKYWSLALFLVGLFGTTAFLVIGINSLSELINMIGYIICLIAGFYGLYTNLIITDNCKVCGSKNSIISVDTPKAQELIKENNIYLPDEVQEESSPQST